MQLQKSLENGKESQKNPKELPNFKKYEFRYTDTKI